MVFLLEHTRLADAMQGVGGMDLDSKHDIGVRGRDFTS